MDNMKAQTHTIGSTRRLALAIVCATMSFAILPAQADVTPVSQRRDVMTFAMISYPGNPNPFCSEEADTLDVGVFAKTIGCMVEDAGNSATGNAAQLSYIFPDLILAEGSIDAHADISGGAEFAEGLGSSRFVSVFSVDVPTEVRLQTLLHASGNGVANLVFRIENGEIFIYHSIFDDTLEVDEWMTLDPGTYELTFTTSGYGQAIEDGSGLPAYGSFSASLEFPTSEVVSPGSFGAEESLAIVAAPNPMRGTTMLFPASGTDTPDREVTILSLDGRVIRRFANVGPAGVAWNATDEHGQSVGAGVYLARNSRGGYATRLVVLP